MSDERGGAMLGVMVIGALIAAITLAASVVAQHSLRVVRTRLAQERAAALAQSTLDEVARWFDAEARRGLIDPAPRSLAIGATWGGADPLAQRLDALLAADRIAALERISIVPPPTTEADLFAAVEVVAIAALPGAATIRVTARGDLYRFDIERFDRPLVAPGTIELRGAAAWGWGEAVAGGDLIVDAAARSSFTPGLPWSGADRPAPDPTMPPGNSADPWWRARAGGAIAGSTSSSPCGSPFPPAPDRAHDLSGLIARCPPLDADPLPARHQRWPEIAPQGLARWIENPARTDCFQLEGGGDCRDPSALVPEQGGLVRIVAAAGRRTPVRLELRGGRGAIEVEAPELEVVSLGTGEIDDLTPIEPRDTAGVERSGRPTDSSLSLRPGRDCRDWELLAWNPPSVPAPSGYPCGRQSVAFAGLIAGSGTVRVTGPIELRGQLRGRELLLDGTVGPARVAALPTRGLPPPDGDGAPGVPQLIVLNRRLLP